MKKLYIIMLLLISTTSCFVDELPIENEQTNKNEYSDLCIGGMLVVGSCYAPMGISSGKQSDCDNLLKLCYAICVKAGLSPLMCVGI